MVRTTIFLNPVQKQRIKKLIEVGHWVTEAELIRRALNIGLDKLEEK